MTNATVIDLHLSSIHESHDHGNVSTPDEPTGDSVLLLHDVVDPRNLAGGSLGSNFVFCFSAVSINKKQSLTPKSTFASLFSHGRLFVPPSVLRCN